MSWPELAGLVVAGILAGTINTIAGGGSLISIPVLIFFGLPANAANATNRIGVFVQSLVSVQQFRKEGFWEPQLVRKLLLPCCLGAVVGAYISVDIDEALLQRIIALIMLGMLGVLLIRPKRWLEGKPDRPATLSLGGWLCFFGVGLYGGFIQAGVGVALLASLVLLLGRDLVQANGIKVMLVAAYTGPALLLYGANDLLHWKPGLAMAAGSALGGWLGARVTVSWGPKFVRAVLSVVIIAASGRLLDLW